MGRFGVRSRPPRLRKNHGIAITKNCSINYIQGSDNMTLLIWMQTNNDGLDLIFTRDGYLKIVVRYRRYLLYYDNQGRPLNCPCEVLLDMLLHFPRRLPELSDNENKFGLEDEDNSSSDIRTTGFQPLDTNNENQPPYHQDGVSIALVISNNSNIQDKGTDSLDSLDWVAFLLNKGSS